MIKLSVSIILIVLLFFLMGYIGEEKGFKSFGALAINFSILFLLLKKVSDTKYPIIYTLFFCTIMSCITLLILNGFYKKTFAAVISVIFVTIIMTFFIILVAPMLKIQGFDYNQSESIEHLSTNVNISFIKLIICELIVGVFSAISDTAITITSSMQEIKTNTPDISHEKLFKSTLNIGSDILGTTVNTLFFIYFGNLIIILIWLFYRDYSFVFILNSKLLNSIVFDILCSGISVIIIIPISMIVFQKLDKIKFKKTNS